MSETEAIERIKTETLGSMEAAYWIVVAYKAQLEADLARGNAADSMRLAANRAIRESKAEDE